jgi:hypothetical protein
MVEVDARDALQAALLDRAFLASEVAQLLALEQLHHDEEIAVRLPPRPMRSRIRYFPINWSITRTGGGSR